MLYIYKNKQIELDDVLLKKYKHFVGMDLQDPEIELYIHNYLARNKEKGLKEEELTENELKEWIEHSMKLDIQIREDP